MTFEESVERFLLEQFVAHQEDSHELRNLSAAKRADAIQKQISVLELSEGLSSVTIGGSDKETSDSKEIIQELLLRFAETTIGAESSTTDMDESLRIQQLVSEVALRYGQSIVDSIVQRALEFSTALLDRVRVQACSLIGALSASVVTAGNDTWGDECLDELKKSLQSRLVDKSQSVRLAAIQACGLFFQSASLEEDDELLEALLWSMWHDPSVANRAAALEVVPISPEVVEHIIVRIRDVKEKVRVRALEILMEVDPVQHMKSVHFSEVVKSGLSMRCDATKKATKTLICSNWMKAAKFNPVLLMKMISVIDHEDECRQVIQVISDVSRSRDKLHVKELSEPEIRSFHKCIEENMISLSSPSISIDLEGLFLSTCWCSLVEESPDVSETEKERIISAAAPDIAIMCDLIQNFATQLLEAEQNGTIEDGSILVCQQLIQLTKIACSREEGSRRHFTLAMKTMASSLDTPSDLVDACMIALRASCTSEDIYLENVSEVLSTFTDSEDQSADTRILSTSRFLATLTVCLENLSTTAGQNPVLSQFGDIVLEAVEEDDSLVREAAVTCLGKLALFSNSMAAIEKYKIPLLSLAMNPEDRIETRSQVLVVLADWSALFSGVLVPCDIDGEAVSLITLLEEFLCNENEHVAALAAEIAVKLLFSGHTGETNLLARLLVIFFDPNSSQEDSISDDIKILGNPARLQQLLSLFFPAYCMKTMEGVGCLLASLRLALEAGSCLSTRKKGKGRRLAFPFLKLVEFVFETALSGEETIQANAVPETTDAEKEKDPRDAYHSSVATIGCIQVLDFLSRDPEITNTQKRTLCKLLASLDLDLENQTRDNFSSLKRLLEELEHVLSDGAASKHLISISDEVDNLQGDFQDDESNNSSQDDGSEVQADGDEQPDDESISDDDTVVQADGDQQADDETISEDDTVVQDDADQQPDDESTLEDSLMNSMSQMNVHDKENTRRSTQSRGKGESGGRLSVSDSTRGLGVVDN